MSDGTGDAEALRPLWALTLGAAGGAAGALAVESQGTGWLHLSSVGIGIALATAALALKPGYRVRLTTALLVMAGLTIVGGLGLHHQADRLMLADLIDPDDPPSIRARLLVTEGWSEGRWGWRTRVRVMDANRNGTEVPLPSRCSLEVRGHPNPPDLTPPGNVVNAFVSLRGSAVSPLLVASSPRLIVTTGARGAVPTLRAVLADGLLSAAKHDLRRIRAAELAATLALGRRDLVPTVRRDIWRRSGLAHVLAVSGLHVGLVAGMVLLVFAAVGAGPLKTRICLLLTLPTYALLAGGSPSAVRAALMGVIYIGARLAGRAIVPMAAVLLTTLALLITQPMLIGEISFQLTILLTAALVRWAPVVTGMLPGPRALAALIAIPVVAQIAAAPIIAHHFASTIPGAAAANLIVPWILGPTVVAAIAATGASPLWPAAGALFLDLVSAGETVLRWAGAPGRAMELVPPVLPTPILGLIVVFGLAALLPGARAKWAAMAYLATVGSCFAWWLIIPPPSRTTVELLPVSDGSAVRVAAPGADVLLDGGGSRREAASMLASARVRRLAAVIASHGDEDHLGGLAVILRTMEVDRLIAPVWLFSSREFVPLLRIARHRGVHAIPVARGSRLDLGPMILEVLWPPAVEPPRKENERSLVGRLSLPHGKVLLTSDVGRTTERHLAAAGDLGCTLLLIPHHGSRHSASKALLDATDPRFALIPAGSKNLHNHPHPEVINRLDERGIPYRVPLRDGRCGATWEDGEWRLFPQDVKREH